MSTPKLGQKVSLVQVVSAENRLLRYWRSLLIDGQVLGMMGKKVGEVGKGEKDVFY